MRAALLTATLAVLSGCGDGSDGGPFTDDCSAEISAARHTYGEPQSVSSIDDRWHRSVTYRWPWQGIQMTFNWGGNRWECSVHTYRFTPVGPPYVWYPAPVF